MLLAFMCEGEREIDEGQLTERCLLSGVGLEEEPADAKKAKSKAPYGSRLGGRAGGCKKKSKAPYGSRTHDLRITSATLYH